MTDEERARLDAERAERIHRAGLDTCDHLCRCGCHWGLLMHFGPCCHRCYVCRKGVLRGMVDAHYAECHRTTYEAARAAPPKPRKEGQANG